MCEWIFFLVVKYVYFKKKKIFLSSWNSSYKNCLIDFSPPRKGCNECAHCAVQNGWLQLQLLQFKLQTWLSIFSWGLLFLSEPNRFQSLTLHNFLYEKVSLINTVHIFIVCFRRYLNKKYWPVRSKKPNYNKIKIYIKTILCNCFNNRRRPCSKHILAHTSVFGYYFNFLNESKMA